MDARASSDDSTVFEPLAESAVACPGCRVLRRLFKQFPAKCLGECGLVESSSKIRRRTQNRDIAVSLLESNLQLLNHNICVGIADSENQGFAGKVGVHVAGQLFRYGVVERNGDNSLVEFINLEFDLVRGVSEIDLAGAGVSARRSSALRRSHRPSRSIVRSTRIVLMSIRQFCNNCSDNVTIS